MGDHTECLQVDFLPDRLSYRELLRFFWDRHNPSKQSPSRQYMNLVLCHDDEQAEILGQLLRKRGFAGSSEVATRVEPLDNFHRAEAYHQKYYLRQDNVLSGFVDGWSNRQITDSPGAALLNGFAAGHLDSQGVLERSRELGLSSEFTEAIRELQQESVAR